MITGKDRKKATYITKLAEKLGIVEGSIVRVTDDKSLWIALQVTEHDIKINRDLQTRLPCLHLFKGFWYGVDVMNHNCYGKMIVIPEHCECLCHVKDLKPEQMQMLM